MNLETYKLRHPDCRREQEHDEFEEREDDRAKVDVQQGSAMPYAPPETVATQEITLLLVLFVYGLLADPSSQAYTTKMGQNPELNRSPISKYQIRRSMRYLALTPARGKTISEYSIHIQNGGQLRKITKWYGVAYKPVDCRITVIKIEGQGLAPSTKD